ncbi:DUF317 domain-containing protein [Streptomyces sp. NPDC056987]|uniref:DUF317 domain-containing protein n=1 Tax=Streptomyces sp. NPDC056987 TaxID=3345988 RepID=UPI00362B2B46
MRRKQRTWGWRAAEQAEPHYLVHPRHLAGGGDLRHVTEYLRAAGWKDRSKSGGPTVFDSPDRSVRLGYDPFVQPGGWTISGRATVTQEAWHATMSRAVPVEIVAGVTDALTRPRPTRAPNVWAPLVHHGWQTSQGEHLTARSPDGTAFVRYHQSSPGEAVWWASTRSEQGRLWDAVFTATTPMHLVQTFAAALANPEPVMRPHGHVPRSTQIRAQAVSVLPSQLRAWRHARIAAARSEAWALSTPGTRRPRTTAPPHATTGRAHARH